MPQRIPLSLFVLLALACQAPVAAGSARRMLAPDARLTPPLDGVEEIRASLRELRKLRHLLLESSVRRRYAIGGRLELLLIDSEDIWEKQIRWLQRYRLLVGVLLEIPVQKYLEDPGTREALVRAIRWARHTAIAMPRIHRMGYLRIQPILDGEVDTRGFQRVGIWG